MKPQCMTCSLILFQTYDIRINGNRAEATKEEVSNLCLMSNEWISHGTNGDSYLIHVIL